MRVSHIGVNLLRRHARLQFLEPVEDYLKLRLTRTSQSLRRVRIRDGQDTSVGCCIVLPRVTWPPLEESYRPA